MADHEITVNQATARLRADYWEDVRDVVADARAEIDLGHLERDRDAIRTYLEETIDGHQCVIYTFQALLTLAFCENEDAGPQDFGDEGWVEDGSLQVSKLAYFAMLADVMQQAESDGLFDLADDDDDDDDDDDTESEG